MYRHEFAPARRKLFYNYVATRIRDSVAARKMRIKDVVNGTLQGDSTLVTQFGTCSEVRLCGTAISKYYNDEKTYGNFVLDDGSDSLVVKFWRSNMSQLDEISIGKLYDVIGTVDEFNDDKNVQPTCIYEKDLHAFLKFHLEVAKEIESLRSQGLWNDVVPIENRYDAQVFSEKSPSAPKYEADYGTSDDVGIETVDFEEESILFDDDDISKNVLECLADEGMSKEQIIEKTGHDEIDVMLALKELLENGEIYEVDNAFKRI